MNTTTEIISEIETEENVCLDCGNNCYDVAKYPDITDFCCTCNEDDLLCSICEDRYDMKVTEHAKELLASLE